MRRGRPTSKDGRLVTVPISLATRHIALLDDMARRMGKNASRASIIRALIDEAIEKATKRS